MDRLQLLESRIDTLEAQAHHWQRIAARYRTVLCTLVLGVAGLAALGAATAPNLIDVVKTNRLEILDPDGNLVLAASADERGGRLDLWTNSGRNVLRFSSNEHGGDLNLWNSEGRSVFGTFATEHGCDAGLWRADGTKAVRFGAGAAGGMMELHGPTGTPVLAAAGTADDELGGTLTLSAADGRRAIHLAADRTGGAMSFYNETQQAVLKAGVTSPSQGGFLDITNAAGSRVIAAGAEANGCGRLDVGNAAGQFVFSVDALPELGATMALLSGQGHKALIMGTTKDGPVFNLFNQHQVPIFVAGPAPDSLGGAMTIVNGRGLPVIHAEATAEDQGEIRVYDAESRSPRIVSPMP